MTLVAKRGPVTWVELWVKLWIKLWINLWVKSLGHEPLPSRHSNRQKRMIPLGLAEAPIRNWKGY